MRQTPGGFIRETKPGSLNVTSQQKVALVRRGNEFFNQGKYDEARRIFLTLGYTDGLIRLGSHYYNKKQYVEALRMFASAPDIGRIQAMAPALARVVRMWLMSDESKEGLE